MYTRVYNLKPHYFLGICASKLSINQSKAVAIQGRQVNSRRRVIHIYRKNYGNDNFYRGGRTNSQKIHIYIYNDPSINYCLFIIKQSRFFQPLCVYYTQIFLRSYCSRRGRANDTLLVSRRQSDRILGGGTDPYTQTDNDDDSLK